MILETIPEYSEATLDELVLKHEHELFKDSNCKTLKARKRRRACNECTRSKVKCNGQAPCQLCVKRGCECVYRLRLRRNSKKKYLAAQAQKALELHRSSSFSQQQTVPLLESSQPHRKRARTVEETMKLCKTELNQSSFDGMSMSSGSSSDETEPEEATYDDIDSFTRLLFDDSVNSSAALSDLGLSSSLQIPLPEAYESSEVFDIYTGYSETRIKADEDRTKQYRNQYKSERCIRPSSTRCSYQEPAPTLYVL